MGTLSCYKKTIVYGPKRRRYSVDVMNALTISAFWKLPLKAFSFVSQKSNPV
jgi:hypothetical protein